MKRKEISFGYILLNIHSHLFFALTLRLHTVRHHADACILISETRRTSQEVGIVAVIIPSLGYKIKLSVPFLIIFPLSIRFAGLFFVKFFFFFYIEHSFTWQSWPCPSNWMSCTAVSCWLKSEAMSAKSVDNFYVTSTGYCKWCIHLYTVDAAYCQLLAYVIKTAWWHSNPSLAITREMMVWWYNTTCLQGWVFIARTWISDWQHYYILWSHHINIEL